MPKIIIILRVFICILIWHFDTFYFFKYITSISRSKEFYRFGLVLYTTTLTPEVGKYGRRDNLFTDYLTDRWQKELSVDLPGGYGVPQGTVLCPIRFLAYMNDVCDLQLRKGNIVTLADDTALIFHGVTWRQVYGIAQSGFNLVYSWLKSKGLTLNVGQTKFIPFTIKNTQLLHHSLHLSRRPIILISCPNLTLASHTK